MPLFRGKLAKLSIGSAIERNKTEEPRALHGNQCVHNPRNRWFNPQDNFSPGDSGIPIPGIAGFHMHD